MSLRTAIVGTSLSVVVGFAHPFAQVADRDSLPPPYHMVVARDGAVGLPVLAPTKDIYSATKQFNRCFAALLVGGVYCEAVNPDGLEFGSIMEEPRLAKVLLLFCG
jgi:hypothetical protein